jgi:hypothetical protein
LADGGDAWRPSRPTKIPASTSWPMDPMLGKLLERQVVPGLCLWATSRAPLPTADLARRVAVGGARVRL